MGVYAHARALKIVGHRVSRTTIARILKRHGLPPMPERPTSWPTFLRAHWGAVAGADFFTTEVWTATGLVTYDTLFVIDLASRGVRILGSTPHPDAVFMQQMARPLVFAETVAGDHEQVYDGGPQATGRPHAAKSHRAPAASR